jgi:rhodanese-related sulfurtransferase
VIFYCRSGSRSALAAAAFRQAGWDAHNLSGGLQAWVEKGLPLDPADGEVADSRPGP